MQRDANNKKGWSWLGFLFMPYYYAGYGALTKGIIAAAVLGLVAGIQDVNHMALLALSLVIGLSVAIYGGLKAREELPIKAQKFNWLNVILAMFIYAIGVVISSMFLTTLGGNTPTCNSTEAKALVKQIAQEKAQEMGISIVTARLTNIRTSSYDENVDKYTCEAEMFIQTDAGISNKAEISYTVQATDDGEHFYVEVYGL